MRPLYESDNDLQNEKQIIKLLSHKWGCSFYKLPIRYHLDYAATRNKEVVAYVEVKARNYSMQQIDSMGGYMLSVGKIVAAKNMWLPSIVVVKLIDGIYQCRIDEGLFPVHIMGRTDRGDNQDVEPCVLIPSTKFKLV